MSNNKKSNVFLKTNFQTMRHSCAHLLALAVKQFFPKVKFGIGPDIENGFYYDFDLSDCQKKTFEPDDLIKIEKRMKELVKKDLKFKKKKISFKEAKEMFIKMGQKYKIELINEIQEPLISCYELGDFVDLCRGPHVSSTKEIGIFKLIKIAGAYWRGDEKNKMLQRIYGLAFFNQKELDDYLKLQTEAEKRDHRNLGQGLGLFSLNEEFGQGLPLWHPKGALLKKIIEDFVLNEYLKQDYQLVSTTHIANLNLFKKSGHWDFYRDYIYSPVQIENEKYIIRPMNCPGHLLIYKSRLYSYRDLPIRFTELGTVYRYEKSGVLHGLTRVRGFTQDDAHIFCTPEQLGKELVEIIKLTKFILKTFGFKDFKVALSIRDPENKKKYLGSDKIWLLAEEALAKAIEKQNWIYEREEGEAVFYGPKMDIKVSDSLNRQWQVSTLQVDFNLPERFDLNYIDKGGKKKRPIMLHRALLGSLERFIGLLIEHYAGAFPLWLSPVQVQIIPVGSRYIKFSQKLNKVLKENNIRSEVDDLNETVGYKIRKAEKMKIPYMLVIGEREAKSETLNVRTRGEKKIVKMKIDKFIKKVLKETEKKK